MNKPVVLASVFVVILSLCSTLHSTRIVALEDFTSASLMPAETDVLELVNGSEAYSYDIRLENIALSHPAFRSAGSAGADEAADWIASQFESFGLDVKKDEFQFTTWDLVSKPTLVIDDDGDLESTSGQNTITSFQSAHYSWPGDVFADLVVLPLPPAEDLSEIGETPIGTLWDAIDTTNKIVLVGREIRFRSIEGGSWEEDFYNRLRAQPPAAVVYTWWYEWMSSRVDWFSSAGGLPLSSYRSYYWDLEIPVGFANYNDGLFMINKESSLDVSARVLIDSVIDIGPHYNVVGKLTGHAEPERFVVVSAHYDTVMCGGFCDNGAGTSGLIELAHVFTEAVERGLYHPKYSVLFVAFAGEEIGLVGSINYVMQHRDEMEDIVAVINLDCIGRDDFCVAETDPADEFDLDEVVLEAAGNLGIDAALTEPGGSDQEVFRNPAWADDVYSWWWRQTANIADAHPVESSTSLWSVETPDWIHTSYDNSTSTEGLNWVEADDLEDHIKVTALTVMRVSPSLLLTDLNNDGTVNILDISIVAVAFGTQEGDKNYDSIADLDKNGEVNIIDISMVAVDYGKEI